MGCLYNAKKVKKIKKTENFRGKIARVRSLLDSGINKKINIFNTWTYRLFFVLLFFCFVASGYALDVTLEWNANNESGLAGYSVFYRQEGQSYNYANPYWETTDSTCTIYDLDETQTYYFTVRAVSTEGFQSGNSNEVCLEAGTIIGNYKPSQK